MFKTLKRLFPHSPEVVEQESPTTLEETLEGLCITLGIIAIIGSLVLLGGVYNKLHTVAKDKSTSFAVLCGTFAVLGVSTLVEHTITNGFVISILHVLKGFYEATALREAVRILSSDLPEIRGKNLHVNPIFPVNIFIRRPIELNEKKIQRMKVLATQFGRIRPITALVELFIVDLLHLRVIYPLLRFVNKVSLGLALIAMFGMIRVSQGPVKKWILSQVTAPRVIVFTLWQTLIVSSVLSLRLAPHSWLPTTENINELIGDLLRISEIVLVALPLAFFVSTKLLVKRVSAADLSKKVSDVKEDRPYLAKLHEEGLAQRRKDLETPGKGMESEVPVTKPVKAA